MPGTTGRRAIAPDLKKNQSVVRQRRKARALAVETLYRFDLVGDVPLKTILDIVRNRRLNPETKRYARVLVDQAVAHLAEIDRRITDTLRGWQFKRLAAIDRAILRLGTCELVFIPDIPPKVCINEAVELTRSYSTEGSAKFVNAVLDRIMKEQEKTANGHETQRAGGA